MLTIKTTIEINASPAQAWECLMDFAHYPEWNPMIPSISGEAKIGGRIDIRLTPPGLVASNYVLKILNVIPEQEFRWLGKLLFPGLMDGDHTFLIQPLSPVRVELTQTENFSGLLIPFLAPFLKRNMLHGFEQMNLALKARVESLHQPASYSS